MKFWKVVTAEETTTNLTAALQAVEEKMHGTVFAVLPRIRSYEIRGHEQSVQTWDVVYYVETEKGASHEAQESNPASTFQASPGPSHEGGEGGRA